MIDRMLMASWMAMMAVGRGSGADGAASGDRDEKGDEGVEDAKGVRGRRPGGAQATSQRLLFNEK